MAAARQRGIDFLLFTSDFDSASSSWTQVGGQRNATINLNTRIIDATNKGNSGAAAWAEKLPSFREWSINFDSIVTDDGSGGFDGGLNNLVNAFLNNQQLGQYIDFPSAITTNDFWYGEAVLGDFSIDTPYDDVATATGTLEGNGTLTRADAAPTFPLS